MTGVSHTLKSVVGTQSVKLFNFHSDPPTTLLESAQCFNPEPGLVALESGAFSDMSRRLWLLIATWLLDIAPAAVLRMISVSIWLVYIQLTS